jgi:hypothetical protein
MGAYPNDRSNDPKAAITYGFDYNFFKQVTPGSSGAGVFGTDCDVVINIIVPTYTVTFWLPPSGGNSGTVQYSFNGNTIHGTLDGAGLTAPQFLQFDNRVISKIWFSTQAGSPVVRVEAWGVR